MNSSFEHLPQFSTNILLGTIRKVVEAPGGRKEHLLYCVVFYVLCRAVFQGLLGACDIQLHMPRALCVFSAPIGLAWILSAYSSHLACYLKLFLPAKHIVPWDSCQGSVLFFVGRFGGDWHRRGPRMRNMY